MLKRERRMQRAWRSGAVLVAAILTAALAGCTTIPAGTTRVMKEGDFKQLAGTWIGSLYTQQEASTAIQGVIQETGAFYIVPRGGGTQTPGTMRIQDGGVVYEAASSKGKMIFSETDKAWAWKWDGMTPDGRFVRHELTKSK